MSYYWTVSQDLRWLFAKLSGRTKFKYNHKDSTGKGYSALISQMLGNQVLIPIDSHSFFLYIVHIKCITNLFVMEAKPEKPLDGIELKSDQEQLPPGFSKGKRVRLYIKNYQEDYIKKENWINVSDSGWCYNSSNGCQWVLLGERNKFFLIYVDRKYPKFKNYYLSSSNENRAGIYKPWTRPQALKIDKEGHISGSFITGKYYLVFKYDPDGDYYGKIHWANIKKDTPNLKRAKFKLIRV